MDHLQSSSSSSKLAPMQPTPSLAHNPAICSCGSNHDLVNSPFFLWIHLPTGQDQVISFKSLKEAYKAAEDYVFIDYARESTSRDSPEDYYGALWTAASGQKWCAPDMDWATPMCSIVDDIKNGIKPDRGGWLVVVTPGHQMIVGQGTDLPANPDVAELISAQGYRYVPDVTDYSTSVDVSAAAFRGRILHEPEPAAAAPQSPTPINLQHTGRHWLTEDEGERSPNLIAALHSASQAQPYVLGSLQSYLRTMLGLSPPATVAPEPLLQELHTPPVNLESVD